MRAPRIEMAQLVPMAGKDSPYSTPLSDHFVVPFNPTTLKVSYTNSVSNESGNDVTQKAGKQTAEFSVDLIFDTTDTSPSTIDWGDATAKGKVQPGVDIDVRIFTARVVAMMKPNPKSSNLGDTSGAPLVRFVWGSFLFDGVLKSLTETLELFSAQGIPLRATLNLNLTQDNLQLPLATTGTGIGVSIGAALFTPMAGANAAGAMVSLGLDPLAGKLMAAANGLDDLRTLPASAALSLPDASIGASASASLGASASASFGVSASASLGVSASIGGAVSAAAAGGFGGGQGIGLTLGGGGNFGLDAGASVGVSAGLNVGIGISGSLGFGSGLGIGANSGLNLGITGGVSGGLSGGAQAAVALPGSGAVGGPRNGTTPGAQVVMDAGGRMALAPAAPPLVIVPPSSSPAVASARTRTAPPPTQGGVVSTGAGSTSGVSRVSGAVGVSTRVATSSSGLPPPLPPQSSGAARGAFEGIHGIPLKRPRFSVGVPPLRPLAYRRLSNDTNGTSQSELCSSSSSAAASASTAAGSCGCAKCQGTTNKGGRCGCQH